MIKTNSKRKFIQKVNKKILTKLLFITALFPKFVTAHGGESTEYASYNMMDGIYGMGFFGWSSMILLLILLIVTVLWIIDQLKKDKGRKKKK